MDLQNTIQPKQFVNEANIPEVQLVPAELQQQVFARFNQAYQQGLRNQKNLQNISYFVQQQYQNIANLPLKQFKNLWTSPVDDTQSDDYSLEVYLKKYLFANIEHLINIQFEIDVFTEDFIKMPSQKYVHQVVNQFSLSSDIPSMFDYFVENCLADSPKNIQPNISTLNSIYLPLLNWIGGILEKNFCYMIDEQEFCRLMLTPSKKKMIYGSHEIVNIQSERLKLFNEKMSQQKRLEAATSSTIQVQKFIGTLLEKRKYRAKKKQSFFKPITQDKWIFQAARQTVLNQQSQKYKAFGYFSDMQIQN